uniref:Uncharacterized protein n=1 Tax=Candidatus Kentrum sp. MB TaxID=2138164 RepID=A0A450XUA4_9GAMM|nr:MAG: hypothetical protein BECKMB1821G_GA0114241_103711 [Candidatus Kentron sp. MB]VFK32846.1 MAG: hypothetical protein BECKMB1821I_GA0114274_103710 [Candidatus Kentron sp. MB]VFK75938.1 MAG: hypothetical protein BECKMB1821H_GA0114242_103617 [Candidatus Kentron sp. MB]
MRFSGHLIKHTGKISELSRQTNGTCAGLMELCGYNGHSDKQRTDPIPCQRFQEKILRFLALLERQLFLCKSLAYFPRSCTYSGQEPEEPNSSQGV